MTQVPKTIIQSAGWIVYYIRQWQPVYLLIKRQAKSKKIEWVAPKWKVDPWETPEQAALREVSEEAWLNKHHLIIKKYVGIIHLRSSQDKYVHVEKDTTFYLMHYTGDPCMINIIDGEW
jgi:8-oxo-dGTP pyrophosphatase MutT (NUDIX family)